AGLDALNDLLAQGLFFDSLNKVARDLEIHVCVQQGHAHFAQRIGDVGLGNLSEPAQVFEGILELAAERVEHGLKVRFAPQRAKCKIVGCRLQVAGWRNTTLADDCDRPATNNPPPARDDSNFKLERHGPVWFYRRSCAGAGTW